jgi:hypothetical protein
VSAAPRCRSSPSRSSRTARYRNPRNLLSLTSQQPSRHRSRFFTIRTPSPTSPDRATALRRPLAPALPLIPHTKTPKIDPLTQPPAVSSLRSDVFFSCLPPLPLTLTPAACSPASLLRLESLLPVNTCSRGFFSQISPQIPLDSKNLFPPSQARGEGYFLFLSFFFFFFFPSLPSLSFSFLSFTYIRDFSYNN